MWLRIVLEIVFTVVLWWIALSPLSALRGLLRFSSIGVGLDDARQRVPVFVPQSVVAVALRETTMAQLPAVERTRVITVIWISRLVALTAWFVFILLPRLLEA